MSSATSGSVLGQACRNNGMRCHRRTFATRMACSVIAGSRMHSMSMPAYAGRSPASPCNAVRWQDRRMRSVHEDGPLLTGAAGFVADLGVDGMRQVAFVRSPTGASGTSTCR